ncbi:MAG: hypothetical protein ABEK10_01325 [Candidatus Nanosalina sp.]
MRDNQDDNPESIRIELGDIDEEFDEVEDADYSSDPGQITVKYSPQTPVEVEKTEDTPDWLVYQVEDMRAKSDEVHEFLDMYERFTEEDWEEMPSEVEGFLSQHGYQTDSDEDPLEWLVNETAEKAVELCEQRDLVSDVYHGIDSLSTGKMTEVEDENSQKIQSEVIYANAALREVKNTGATTEGGFTEPRPAPDTSPEYSLGHNYRQKLEEAAEEVDWVFERRAYWD